MKIKPVYKCNFKTFFIGKFSCEPETAKSSANYNNFQPCFLSERIFAGKGEMREVDKSLISGISISLGIILNKK